MRVKWRKGQFKLFVIKRGLKFQTSVLPSPNGTLLTQNQLLTSLKLEDKEPEFISEFAFVQH